MYSLNLFWFRLRLISLLLLLSLKILVNSRLTTMGNQSSHLTMGNHSSQASKSLYNEILSQFSDEEKTILLQAFGEFSSDNIDEQSHGKHREAGVTALSI